MGLTISKLRKKCGLCKNRRAQRYCLRYGKDICWVCCNDNRIDSKCPKQCSYPLEIKSESHRRMRVDSVAEHIGFTILEIDRWCELPEKALGDKIPAEMAKTKEGKDEIEKYLQTTTMLPPQTEAYLVRKLNLAPREIVYDHYEDIATKYLDKIIEQDWEATIELMSNSSRYQEPVLRDNYLKRRANNRLLKRMTSYHLILSMFSEKQDEAMVYFEVNSKYDLTVHLQEENEDWRVAGLIIGHPQMYYNIDEIEKHIHGYLQHGDKDTALQYLKKFVEIYVDSKEIYYLYGLYYSELKDFVKTGEMFLNCLELDPASYDHRFNYAVAMMASENSSEAKKYFEKLIKERPDDLKVLNNLGVLFLKEGEIEKAKEMWERCLEVDGSFELAQKNLDKFIIGTQK